MHIFKYTLIVVLLFIFAPSFAVANDTQTNSGFSQVKGKSLRKIFANTLMIGEYRDYRGETKTFNYTEFHNANGKTDYIEGQKKEDGIWTVIGNDKVCYKYPKSEYYTRTYCFLVYELEGCYYKFAPYNMTLNGPRSWDKWSSRAVRKGSGNSCAAAIG
ncbi:MAG: hypothetical protein COA43_10630 [Robiginitomaculum sp.]|nr:MAG: hypothetical protein COA43_10630 [Robiginitomaculum sp.]